MHIQTSPASTNLASTDQDAFRDPCSVLIIRTTGSSCYLTKIWSQGPDGKPIQIKPVGMGQDGDFKHPANFRPRLLPLPHKLHSLRPVLERGNMREAILRDVLKTLPPKGAKVRRNKELWTQTERHLFLIDLDNFDFPGLSPQDEPDLVAQRAVEHLAQFWPELRGADCLYQFSASQNFKDGIRLHLWFWADLPISSQLLKWKSRLVNQAAGTQLIDENLYNVAQLHYTAKPLLLGGIQDPLPRRVGLLQKQGDVPVKALIQDWKASLTTDAPALDQATTAAPKAPAIPRTPAPDPDGAEPNGPWIQGAIRGNISDCRNPNDGRKRRLYAAALRIASLFAWSKVADKLRRLGHTPHSVQTELISAGVDAGLDHERAQLDVENGWNKGRLLQADDQNLWLPLPINLKKDDQDDHNQDDHAEPPAQTLADLRAEIPRRLQALKPSQSLMIGLQCGVGKTWAKRRFVRHTPRGVLRIIVSKDRKAAIEDHEAIKGSVLLLGKSSAGIIPTDDWTPQSAGDGDRSTCINPNAQKNSRRGGSSQKDCSGCPFQAACTDGQNGYLGTRGMWRQAKKTLRKGGVLVITPQLLPAVLSLLDSTKNPPHVDLIWFDDTHRPPGHTLLTPAQLRDAANALLPGPEKDALDHAAQLLEEHEATTDPGQFGRHKTRIDTRKHLLQLDHAALRKATQHDGVPLALNALADFLERDDSKASAYLIRSHEGAQLRIDAAPIQLPPEAKIIVSSATTQPAIWEAWTRRTFELWAPTIDADINGTWLQSAVWHPLHIELEDLPVLLSEAERTGQRLTEPLQPARRLLVVTHKKNIDHHHFRPMLDRMLKSAGASPHQLEIIHWRGVDQVGSDAYNGFDTVLTLGSPYLHKGAWQMDLSTVDTWSPGKSAALSYEDEAIGYVDQADGRPRFLTNPGTSLIHIGNTPSRTLRAVCPHPIRVDAPIGRPATSRQAAQEWLASLPFDSLSAALHQLPGAPSRDTLARLVKDDPRTRWTVHLSGRGGPQIWRANDWRQAKRDVEQLLWGRGGGEVDGRCLLRIESDEHGVVYCAEPRIKNGSSRSFAHKTTPATTGSAHRPDSIPRPPPPPPPEKPEARLIELIQRVDRELVCVVKDLIQEPEGFESQNEDWDPQDEGAGSQIEREGSQLGILESQRIPKRSKALPKAPTLLPTGSKLFPKEGRANPQEAGPRGLLELV